MRKPRDPTEGLLLTVSLGMDTPVGELGESAPSAESQAEVERTTQIGVGRSTVVKGNRLQEAHAMEGSWGRSEQTPGVVK